MKKYLVLTLILLVNSPLFGQSDVVKAAARLSEVQNRYTNPAESFSRGYDKAKSNSSPKPVVTYTSGEKSFNIQIDESANQVKPRYIDFTGFIGQWDNRRRKNVMRSAQNWSFEPIRTSKPSRWDRARPVGANNSNTLFCEMVRSASNRRVSPTEIETNTTVSVYLTDYEGNIVFSGDFRNYTFDSIMSELYNRFK